MGINVRWQEAPKQSGIITAQVNLEKDLRSCMHCKFFYGNNSQCLARKCVREESKGDLVATFLEEYPKVSKISFCLDNDEPGRKAAEALMEKYYGLDYEVESCPPPKPFKDYNQWLQTAKRCISAPEPPRAAVR